MNLDHLQTLLNTSGIHALLRELNARTPHRFTGVYRYDPPTLRSEFLFDCHNPDQLRGDDSPLAATYCSLLLHEHNPLVLGDAHADPRIERPHPQVLSYTGARIDGPDGKPWGSLCHFDLRPCEPRPGEIEVLQSLAPLVVQSLERAMTATKPAES